MSQPFVAEIMMFAGNFAPSGYALCNGQILSISQNQALFALIGTSYGGNGQSNFALPNLQDGALVSQGNGVGLSPYVVGEQAGVPSVTLNSQEMASHNHLVKSAAAGVATQRTGVPSNTVWMGDSEPGQAYTPTTTPLLPFFSQAIGIGGNPGALPHANVQPVLALNFCIALRGQFPSRN